MRQRERRFWNVNKKAYDSEMVDEPFNKLAMMPVSPEVAIFQREHTIDVLSERGELLVAIAKEDWKKFAEYVNIFNDGLNET